MPDPLSPDVLPRVVISPAAVERWREAVSAAVARLPGGTDPESMPDERAEVAGDRLRVYVPDGRGGALAEMFVGPGEWAWADGRN